MQRVEFRINKSKLWLLFLFCIAFVIIGCWFLVLPPHVRLPGLFIRFAGLISVAFFGFGLSFIGKKLSSQTPGLVIEADGFFDNSSGVVSSDGRDALYVSYYIRKP